MAPSAPGGGWAAHIIAKRKDPEREEPCLKGKQVQPPSHFSQNLHPVGNRQAPRVEGPEQRRGRDGGGDLCRTKHRVSVEEPLSKFSSQVERVNEGPLGADK